ncbi:MAG: hypothetical protein CVV23_11970 [Ignavibacteriae bacterium HGW-Ignavibacteriae-2]|jgi:hypothetical protein|nr:hypothetical protein [Bacteroidota bacterium]PKL88103.1 MAG: hypothetical protein CVV23_11970 [Ignavibacteriae bacterium HGW-Ignavibacteriae-2]
MLIALVISYSASLIWFTLPYFQRESKYFYFFCVLAISALLSSIAFTFHIVTPVKFVVPTAFLMIPSLYRDFFKKYIFLMLITAIALFIIFYDFSSYLNQLISLFAFIIVLILMLSDFVKETLISESIKIVLLVVVIYQLSIVLKYIVLLNDLFSGYLLFLLSSAFEILIGLFFIFAKEQNIKLIIKIR